MRKSRFTGTLCSRHPSRSVVPALLLVVAIVFLLFGCNTPGPVGTTDQRELQRGVNAGDQGAESGEEAAANNVATESAATAPETPPETVPQQSAPDASAPDQSAPEEPSAPVIGPVTTDGIPLQELFPAQPGLRLSYRLIRGGEETDRSPAVVLQPSTQARANIAVHGNGVSSYVVMGQDETAWYPVRPVVGGTEAAVLAMVPWARFFPRRDEIFRFSRPHVTVRLRPDGADSTPAAAWSVGYRFDREYGNGLYGEAVFTLAPTTVEPGGETMTVPVLIRYADPRGTELRYELTSAAVYREREVTGVVVNRFGRPQPGFVVAPHPLVGLLPEKHRSTTDAAGRFQLAYRAAPGDVIRLFYGPSDGAGTEARIFQPNTIFGRVESPDFATLIYNAPE